jgi:hypothetical protein
MSSFPRDAALLFVMKPEVPHYLFVVLSYQSHALLLRRYP